MNCTSHRHKEHIVVVEFMKRKLAFVFGEIVACLAKFIYFEADKVDMNDSQIKISTRLNVI